MQEGSGEHQRVNENHVSQTQHLIRQSSSASLSSTQLKTKRDH